MGSRSGVDAMEAGGIQVRSWTSWRQVGPRSGLGCHGVQWAPGPVLESLEGSGLQVRCGRYGGGWAPGPVWALWRRVCSRSDVGAMEAGGLQVQSWTLWREVGSKSGVDTMEAGGIQVRSWTPWRQVGPASGLGPHGVQWSPGPVLDAMEATKLSTSADNRTIRHTQMQTVA